MADHGEIDCEAIGQLDRLDSEVHYAQLQYGTARVTHPSRFSCFGGQGKGRTV